MFCKARKPPIALQGEVHAELDRMERNGVISPVTNGTEWASPLVVIPKRDGRLRIYCDYKVAVKKCLLDDVYNLPSLEVITSKIAGAKYFAKYDL